jgi:hypothetical protein
LLTRALQVLAHLRRELPQGVQFVDVKACGAPVLLRCSFACSPNFGLNIAVLTRPLPQTLINLPPRRYVGDATSRSGDDGYVSQSAFGKQSRLSKQKHQITAVAMDLMLNEKEILAVSHRCGFVSKHRFGFVLELTYLPPHPPPNPFLSLQRNAAGQKSRAAVNARYGW